MTNSIQNVYNFQRRYYEYIKKGVFLLNNAQ